MLIVCYKFQCIILHFGVILFYLDFTNDFEPVFLDDVRFHVHADFMTILSFLGPHD